MKIAYIGSRGFPGFNAGVEKSLEEICPRMAARGHEMTLYCSEQVTTSEPSYKNTLLHRMPAIPTKHLETLSRTAFSAWDALFRGYDIVHFHSIGPALLSWLMVFNHCKTVVTVHGLDWQRAKWGALAKGCLQGGEMASVFFPDQTIVVSQHLKRHYASHYNKPVVYIPNGVNVAVPLPAKQIHEKWGLLPKDYVLFASRLVPEKECHTLIRAFQTLQTDKKLVIAGESWHSDDYVAGLKEMAKNDPRIIFTGWAEGDILTELYSNAYLYCLPSTVEGLSLALLEAMSFGLCPLVSDIPENMDVIEKNGVSFETGNSADLARRLGELIKNPEKTKRLGALAQDAVLIHYSWDRNCEDLERVYLELVEDRNLQYAQTA